uniref:Non-specific serine/threonine protein kinase n=1 Tax=Macrostomum lignano TaxID=282301 RepID=A0A1I8GNS4_9PLAT
CRKRRPSQVRDALLTLPPTVDLNCRDSSGRTVAHVAADSGSVEALMVLEQRGADLHQLNTDCENGLHLASRVGNDEVAAFFLDRSVCPEGQNRAGETPLHLACRGGHLTILRLLLLGSRRASPNSRDRRHQRTPLVIAASEIRILGIEVARVLLRAGARPDIPDSEGWGPLRHAIQRQHQAMAMLLISAGAPLDQLDSSERDSPLHAASRLGQLPVVQALCAYGCRVDAVNVQGLTPLHQTARAGHLEVVRCLLLAGANPQLASQEGLLPEVMSLAQGHTMTASLLGRMRPERRAVCVEQLVFGHSGSGKTALIDSLRSNRITGFLRRTFLAGGSGGGGGSGASTGQVIVGDCDDELDRRQCVSLLQRSSAPSEISFDAQHEAYTRGIAVQNLNITGAGDFSVWEFSGYEPYYLFYDHFIGDTSCVHAILFSLAECYETMRQRVLFWLHFLLARLPPREPLGYCGKPKTLARVLLIGTHADAATVFRGDGPRGLLESADADRLLLEVQELAQYRLEVCHEVFAVDTSEAMSAEMKSLRQRLADWRTEILRHLPRGNGLLDTVASRLPEWAGATEFPVFTWRQFIEAVRGKVNPLCSDDHLKDLIQELQYTGDVVYLESEVEQDMIVLSPQWLCSDVLGYLLSYDNIAQARVTGTFSVNDVQFMTGETAADQLVRLLSALDLCTRADLDGGAEDSDVPSASEYSSSRLQTTAFEPLRIDLFQWFHGSKLSLEGCVECMLQLEESDQLIRLRARGPPARAQLLFGICQDIAGLLEQTIDDMCPGLEFDLALLSPKELRDLNLAVPQSAVFRAMQKHQSTTGESSESGSLISFPPPTIPIAFPASGSTCDETQDEEEEEEDLENLICFGSRELLSHLTLGPTASTSPDSAAPLRMFDPPDPLGKDWCLLAVRLGLTHSVPAVHSGNEWLRSRTAVLLDEWRRVGGPGGTNVGALVDVLRELGREDAVELLIAQAPMFALTQSTLMQAIGDSTKQDWKDSAVEEFLLKTIKHGNLRDLETALKSRTDIDRLVLPTGDRMCTSPLHLASREGRTDAARVLIDFGASVNLQNSFGISPLYLASKEGHLAVVNLLIDYQADFILHQSMGRCFIVQALIKANADKGHANTVKLLINAQADINLQRSSGESPLFIASLMGHGEVVKTLLKAQATCDVQESHGATPLFIASQLNHPEVVRLLIERQADLNLQRNNGASAIYIAAEKGFNFVIDFLIAANADIHIPTNSGATPIFIASQNGHLRAAAQVNAQDQLGQTPLLVAAQHAHYKIVKGLIENEADVNLQSRSGLSPIYTASQEGHCIVVDLLIRSGANVNLQAKSGATPLYIAAQNGHLRVVESLIQARADVNLQSKIGETPAYIASQNGHYQIVRLLLKAGADIDACSETGASPLYVASQFGHRNVVQLLLTAQASVNQQLITGETPLFIASQKGHGVWLMRFLKHRQTQRFRQATKRHRFSLLRKIGTINEQDVSQQSDELHSALRLSGFVDSRVALQTAVADVLQQIVRDMNSYDGYYIVDSESDIDMMQLIPGRLYHLKGACRCPEIPESDKVEYADGHIVVSGFASNPAKPINGSELKPAVDNVDACRLCCYPPIAIFLPERLRRSNILESVLKSLQDELVDSPCHIVHAAPAGMAGQQLRVSTTFLEKRLLRSLTTLQGQVFVSLKYLVKKTVMEAVQTVIRNLPQYLAEYKNSLKPLGETGVFYFHPFQILPHLPGSMSQSKELKYHEIYGVVRRCLYLLSAAKSEAYSQQTVAELTDRLPDCARSARETLRALNCLKLGQREAAVKILTDFGQFPVSLGIDWSARMTANNATEDLVRKHLSNSDSAWKFCFKFSRQPLLDFLPRFFSECFPLQLSNMNTYYFVNFDALLHGLRLEFVPSDERAYLWIQAVADRNGADLQEIAISARYCPDQELLLRLLRKPVRHWVPNIVQEEIKKRLDELSQQRLK